MRMSRKTRQGYFSRLQKLGAWYCLVRKLASMPRPERRKFPQISSPPSESSSTNKHECSGRQASLLWRTRFPCRLPMVTNLKNFVCGVFSSLASERNSVPPSKQWGQSMFSERHACRPALLISLLLRPPGACAVTQFTVKFSSRLRFLEHPGEDVQGRVFTEIVYQARPGTREPPLRKPS